MYKVLLLLLTFGVTTASCYSQVKTKKRNNFFRAGKEKYEVLAKSPDIWHGEYTYEYSNIVRVTGHYSHGEKNGMWKYKIGDQFKIIAYYKNDKKDSLWTFYNNNRIISEVRFDDNKRDGASLGYYSNGDLKSIIPFRSGEVCGIRKVYYQGNKTKVEVEYFNGHLDGPLKFYNQDGEIILHLEYRDNRPFSLEKLELPDSLKYFNGTLRNGTGLIQIYSKSVYTDSLILVSVQEYKDGYLNGRCVEYAENGNLKFDGHYINDIMVGQWNFYNPYIENVHKVKMYSLKDSIKLDSTNIYTVTPTIIGIFEFDLSQFSKGGDEGFRRFIKSNLYYPVIAGENNISGIVYTKFNVDIVGETQDIRIIKSPHQIFNNEAIRVINLSPHWIPGFVDNIPITFTIDFPIIFVIN